MAATTMDPRLIESNGQALVKGSTQLATDQHGIVLDRDWAKSAFLISDNQLGDPTDVANRYWSSASAKFTDGRLGCNIGINAKPQFTRYSDIRSKGRLAGRTDVSITNTAGNHGMGRYYSEAIDDPSQTIYMRFGMPQFNSITNFVSKAFDTELSSLARTGRSKGFFYNIGKIAGTVIAVVAFPSIALTILAGKAISSIFMRPTSKFYTMKPAMHLYWSTVNTLVNTQAINRGIFPKIMASEEEQRLGRPFKLDQEYLEQLSTLMPGVFKDSSYFDMYAIANRAQRLANKMFIDDFEKLNNGTATDYTGYLKKNVDGVGGHPTYITDSKGEPKLGSVINRLATLSYYLGSDTDARMEADPRVDGASETDGQKKDPSFFQDLASHFDAEFKDGSQFATFKVDHTGSVESSFANSLVESDLSQKLNATSSQMRQARFSFADGNIVGGVAGEAIGAVAGAVTDVATGALDGVTMGFSSLLAGLGGSGYIDIPKHWQSSSASLPRSSYTMQLISPYGNAISQIQNIDIPLFMIMAAAMPLSTGKQSYTSPFLCQLFDRGRCQVRLGMIESLSITRGTSNLAFNTKGNAMALDVTFTVADLSSIMHMPISSGSILETDMTIDEDNILADYLAVLAGQDIYSQIYAMPKAKLVVAKKLMGLSKLTSPAYWMSMFHESATSGTLQYLTLGAFNVLEGATRGLDTAR